MKKAIPLNDKIVARQLEAEELTSASGLLIAPELSREKPHQAVVEAVGPGRLLDNGSRVAPGVDVGDLVLFNKYSGSEFDIDGDKLLVLDESDILAVLRDTDE